MHCQQPPPRDKVSTYSRVPCLGGASSQHFLHSRPSSSSPLALIFISFVSTFGGDEDTTDIPMHVGWWVGTLQMHFTSSLSAVTGGVGGGAQISPRSLLLLHLHAMVFERGKMLRNERPDRHGFTGQKPTASSST